MAVWTARRTGRIPSSHSKGAAEEIDENLSYEDELLRDVERSKQAGATNEYRSTYHVSPTSNK